MKKIFIYGAGGFGREVLQIILDINRESPVWDMCGFLVDPEYITQNSIHGYTVYADKSVVTNDAYVAVAIGSSSKRLQVVNQLKVAGHTNFATLVHPRAWIGRKVHIGAGSIICSGAQLTTDIYVGEYVQVHVGATVGHDAILNEYATVSPNVSLSGGAVLECGVDIGAGSVIIPRTIVGAWSILGAGSVVTKDIPANSTAVGCPARVVKERPAGWQLHL